MPSDSRWVLKTQSWRQIKVWSWINYTEEERYKLAAAASSKFDDLGLPADAVERLELKPSDRQLAKLKRRTSTSVPPPSPILQAASIPAPRPPKRPTTTKLKKPSSAPVGNGGVLSSSWRGGPASGASTSAPTTTTTLPAPEISKARSPRAMKEPKSLDQPKTATPTPATVKPKIPKKPPPPIYVPPPSDLDLDLGLDDNPSPRLAPTPAPKKSSKHTEPSTKRKRLPTSDVPEYADDLDLVDAVESMVTSAAFSPNPKKKAKKNISGVDDELLKAAVSVATVVSGSASARSVEKKDTNGGGAKAKAIRPPPTPTIIPPSPLPSASPSTKRHASTPNPPATTSHQSSRANGTTVNGNGMKSSARYASHDSSVTLPNPNSSSSNGRRKGFPIRPDYTSSEESQGESSGRHKASVKKKKKTKRPSRSAAFDLSIPSSLQTPLPLNDHAALRERYNECYMVFSPVLSRVVAAKVQSERLLKKRAEGEEEEGEVSDREDGDGEISVPDEGEAVELIKVYNELHSQLEEIRNALGVGDD